MDAIWILLVIFKLHPVTPPPLSTVSDTKKINTLNIKNAKKKGLDSPVIRGRIWMQFGYNK